MALAVAEAHRVLRPTGLLVSLHPAPAPLQLAVWHPQTTHDRTFALSEHQVKELGALQPYAALQDFAATTAALNLAPAAGFHWRARHSFAYRYFFETLDDLTDYLSDTAELEHTGDDLLESALHALHLAPRPPWLVLSQTVWLNVLACQSTTAS